MALGTIEIGEKNTYEVVETFYDLNTDSSGRTFIEFTIIGQPKEVENSFMKDKVDISVDSFEVDVKPNGDILLQEGDDSPYERETCPILYIGGHNSIMDFSATIQDGRFKLVAHDFYYGCGERVTLKVDCTIKKCRSPYRS